MTQLLFQRPLCLCHSGDAVRRLLGRPRRLEELTMVGQILGHPQRRHAAVTFSRLMIVGSMKRGGGCWREGTAPIHKGQGRSWNGNGMIALSLVVILNI